MITLLLLALSAHAGPLADKLQRTIDDTARLNQRARDLSTEIERGDALGALVGVYESQVRLEERWVELEGQLQTTAEEIDAPAFKAQIDLNLSATRQILDELAEVAMGPRLEEIQTLVERGKADQDVKSFAAADEMAEGTLELTARLEDLLDPAHSDALFALSLDASTSAGAWGRVRYWGGRCVVECEDTRVRGLAHLGKARAALSLDKDKKAAALSCKTAVQLHDGLATPCDELVGKRWRK